MEAERQNEGCHRILHALSRYAPRHVTLASVRIGYFWVNHRAVSGKR